MGSLPTADGTSATASAGCLLVLNSKGSVVETFSGHGINGPWDMTALDLGPQAELFVTNVLNGTFNSGTVRPTGVGLGPNGTLYVADTLANRIAAIPNAVSRGGSAGHGTTVSQNGNKCPLNGPLGLAIAPNGDVLTVNGNDGFIVETTPAGKQVAKFLLDGTGSPPGAGTLFGLAVAPQGTGVYFVDDWSNTLNLFH